MSDIDVPVIDLESADVVTSLASAYETVGFAQVVGHGVPRSLIAAVFDASARFHRLPLEEKLAIELDRHHRGYIAIDTSTDRRSELGPASQPNQSASFMMMREASPDDLVGMSLDELSPEICQMVREGREQAIVSHAKARKRSRPSSPMMVSPPCPTTPVSMRTFADTTSSGSSMNPG